MPTQFIHRHRNSVKSLLFQHDDDRHIRSYQWTLILINRLKENYGEKDRTPKQRPQTILLFSEMQHSSLKWLFFYFFIGLAKRAHALKHGNFKAINLFDGAISGESHTKKTHTHARFDQEQ